MNGLLHVLGLDDMNGRWYAFYSGIGSFLPGVAMLGGIATLVRKHSCHVHGCWRVGRHPVDGTGFVVCRRHHPTLGAGLRAEDLPGA